MLNSIAEEVMVKQFWKMNTLFTRKAGMGGILGRRSRCLADHGTLKELV